MVDYLLVGETLSYMKKARIQLRWLFDGNIVECDHRREVSRTEMIFLGCTMLRHFNRPVIMLVFYILDCCGYPLNQARIQSPSCTTAISNTSILPLPLVSPPMNSPKPLNAPGSTNPTTSQSCPDVSCDSICST